MSGSPFDFEKPIADLESKIAWLNSPDGRSQAKAEGIDIDAVLPPLETELRRAMRQVYSNLSPWEKTQMARHKDRPYTLDYIRMVFDEFMELSGDRLAGNDEAIVGGLARLNGDPVVVVGQQKGRDLKERQRRNFGSARAEGFRKALRLAKLAEKFQRPLISFVDTAGAAADLHAEEMGVSEAIARNLREYSALETPMVAVVIGEGGSGGALGVALADQVLMLEHSIYSVISPEGCAAILWYDKARASDAAEALKLTAEHARKFGLIDRVIPEPMGGAHRDPAATAAALKSALVEELASLKAQAVPELVSRRYERLRRIGEWNEA